MGKRQALLLLVGACSSFDAPTELVDGGVTDSPATPDSAEADAGAAMDSGTWLDAPAPLDAWVRDAPVADVGVEVDGGARPRHRGVFVLQGQVGRTALSCDGGETWVHDSDGDPSVRCRPAGDYDCAHDARAGRGLTFLDGTFFATGGFGVARSRDGARWETVYAEGGFGAIAAGNGAVVAGAFRSALSPDGGETWRSIGPTGLQQRSVRRGAYLPDSRRFVLVSSIITRDEYDLVLSEDGETWRHPLAPPDQGMGCLEDLNATGGIVEGDGITVALGSSGIACISGDGAETWRSVRAAPRTDSSLVWTGTHFVFFAEGQRHQSADGATWEADAIMPAGLRLGALAFGDGRFVAVNRGGAYANQTFYFSDDGITWREAASFAGGHPVGRILFGAVDSAEAACSDR